MQREVRLIEEQLNKLCSQHDELMSLLQIVDYLPSIKYLQNLNASLGSRISLADKHISETLPSLFHYSQQDQEQISLKSQQFNQLIHRSQLLIDQIHSQFDTLNASATKLEPRVNSKALDEHQQTMKRSLRALTQQSEEFYARECARQKRKLRANSQAVKQTIDLRLVNGILYSYERLQTKIAAMRLSLDVPPLEEFRHYTCGRIKKELEAIRAQVQQKTKKQTEEQLQVVKCRLVQLKFQTRGLKQLCGEQLMMSLGQNQEKGRVYATQQTIVTQIGQIEQDMLALSRIISQTDFSIF